MPKVAEVERRQIPLLDIGKPVERERPPGRLVDVNAENFVRGTVECPRCGEPAIPFRLGGWSSFHFAHQVEIRGTAIERGRGCRASWSPEEVRRWT